MRNYGGTKQAAEGGGVEILREGEIDVGATAGAAVGLKIDHIRFERAHIDEGDIVAFDNKLVKTFNGHLREGVLKGWRLGHQMRGEAKGRAPRQWRRRG